MMVHWVIFLAAVSLPAAYSQNATAPPPVAAETTASAAAAVGTTKSPADLPAAPTVPALAPTTKESITCGNGTVALPDQSGCKAYTLVYFEWFGGPGLVVIILMAIVGLLVLFALGVFTLNTGHEVVQRANYLSLLVFLLALVLLALSPVPLLMKPPTGGSCSAYILLFNLSVAIVLGVLTSRSASVNQLFNENGGLVKGYLGSYPRTTIVVAVTVIQLIVLIVSFSMETVQTMHNPTDVFDEMYHECSSWASTTFWAGFVFNIVVSVVGNSMSCSSVDMISNVRELKYVLLGHLMWYMWGLVDLIVFFRCNDQHLAGGQAIVALLLALSLFIVYPFPKIYAIFFQSKDGKLITEEDIAEEEQGLIDGARATAISSKAGLTGAGVVAMKIEEA